MQMQTQKVTSAMAVASLVCGVLAWLIVPLLGAILAVVFGHMGRGQIRRGEATDGDGLAIAGLVLGYLQLLLIPLALIVMVMFFGGLAWLGAWTG